MALLVKVILYELVALLVQFLLGNSYLLLPASADCPRVALLSGFLLLTTVAAATILLSVLMALKSAHAKKQRVARLRRLEAARAAPRLFLAIGLSAASTFLAVPAFENGYGYWKDASTPAIRS